MNVQEVVRKWVNVEAELRGYEALGLEAPESLHLELKQLELEAEKLKQTQALLELRRIRAELASLEKPSERRARLQKRLEDLEKFVSK